jgi:hypothetical protein
MTQTIIRDIQIFWSKLDTPVSPFGGDPAYELQVRAPKKRRKELEQYGNVKEVDGVLAVNLKRYAKNAKGEEVTVDVFDGLKQPFSDLKSIGNGSKGAVKVFQYENPRGGRPVTRLMAVQILELVKYEATPEVDFDAITDVAVEEDF